MVSDWESKPDGVFLQNSTGEKSENLFTISLQYLCPVK
jgi:hypothetical protein